MKDYDPRNIMTIDRYDERVIRNNHEFDRQLVICKIASSTYIRRAIIHCT